MDRIPRYRRVFDEPGRGVKKLRRAAGGIAEGASAYHALNYSVGMLMEIRVPLPGAVSIVKRPPSFSILSLMIRSP